MLSIDLCWDRSYLFINKSCFGQLLRGGGGLFFVDCFSSLAVLKILWARYNWFSYQLSHCHIILRTKTTINWRICLSLLIMRKHSIFEFFLITNLELRMKGDQTYMCNLQLWVTIFSELYLILWFMLCRYIDITWHI